MISTLVCLLFVSFNLISCLWTKVQTVFKMINNVESNTDENAKESDDNASSLKWQSRSVDQSIECGLELKDCYLLTLSCVEKFEQYIHRHDDNRLFAMQTHLVKLLLLQSCKEFGFENVVFEGNQVCFKEAKIDENEMSRGYKFDKDFLFDNLIETYLSHVNRPAKSSNVAMSNADTTSGLLIAEHESTSNDSLRKTNDDELQDNEQFLEENAKKNERIRTPSNKDKRTSARRSPHFTHIESKKGFPVEKENLEQNFENVFNSTQECPKVPATPKNENKKGFFKKKKRSFPSPTIPIRRSKRSRVTMPASRLEIVHRNIHRALGKTDEQISASFLDLSLRNKNNMNFTARSITAEPRGSSTSVGVEKISRKKVKNSVKRITVLEDITVGENSNSEKLTNANCNSSTPEKLRPRALEADFDNIKVAMSQTSRGLTPKRQKKVKKLCERVCTLPSKTEIKKKKMSQKKKLSTSSSKSEETITAFDKTQMKRKLYSPEDWLTRINGGDVDL